MQVDIFYILREDIRSVNGTIKWNEIDWMIKKIKVHRHYENCQNIPHSGTRKKR